MNPKMENLIEQLQEECEKAGVSLVLGTINPEDCITSTLFSGKAGLQAIIVAMLNDELRDLMEHSDCHCPNCMATKEMMFHE